MGPNPFFTILLPTKGRAHHLRFALESLRQQSFGDFEAIILDSDPGTEIARAWFGGWQSWLDERFRYVRTGDVWMSENFERGLEAVRGRYLHVCQDKAVMALDALEAVHARLSHEPCDSLVFELVSHTWEQGNHGFAAPAPGLSELQLQPVFRYGSGMSVETTVLSSRQVLDEFLVQGWEPICFKAPRAFNCFTRVACIEAIRSRGVPFFDTMSPDLCSALRLLDHLDSFHATPARLASHYHGAEVSFGTSWRYRFSYANEAFARLDPAVLAHQHLMPLGLMPIFHNGIFGDYVNVRRSASGLLKHSRLRAHDYFAKVLQDIDNLHEDESLKQRLRAIVERCRDAHGAEFI